MGYPRSFVGMLLAGFLLITLPLIAALLYSAWKTEELAVQSRSAVHSAAQASRASRMLVNRTASIERLALQMAVFPNDTRLAAEYDKLRASIREIADELTGIAPDHAQRVAVTRTLEQEAALSAALAGPLRPRDAARIRTLTSRLVEDAYQLAAISDRVADREVARLRANAESVQRRLVLLVLFGTAVALAIALLLSRHISRPISEIDDSIRQLGEADFSREITVRGPQDLRSLGERLDWLRRRLAEVEEERNRFLRHLSHELKTPLTALREGTELLNDGIGGPLGDTQRQVVSIMRENSIELQRLIEDLLDYQRAVHAAATLAPRPVALDSLAREVAHAHELAVRAKGQHLAVDAARVSVEGDPDKLRAILDNLVGNAVKFTPAGGSISVSVRAEGDEAALDVIDSGPGVPAAEKEAIFDSFFRGRARAGGRVRGTGLGLAIAREFAEAHGGRICVIDAAVGRDTSGGHFRVTLPRRISPKLAAAA
ncbi:MAG: ATP-binding protein [Betaproteobacteria bacterium]